jgi:serine/threonine protein kinase
VNNVPVNRVGETYGKYRVVRKIDEGAMGEVYEAVDVSLNRPVALKFLRSYLWKDPVSRERFYREARAASALDHPNVCTIYGVGEAGPDDSTPFIAMAYCDGETLATKIRSGPLPLADVVSFGKQIAAGLLAAHNKGIIHRDVKPGNVMVRDDGLVKILDFGLAKLRESSTITHSDSILGTLPYMSPEQCLGAGTDHRTDIWALGAILYEMTTGTPAFYDDNPAGITYGICNEDPVAIKELQPDVPDRLVAIVEKALDKDTARRYENLEQLRMDLERVRPSGFVDDSPGTSPGTESTSQDARDQPEGPAKDESAPQSRRGFPVIAVAGLGVMVAVIGILFFSGAWPETDGPGLEILPTAENSSPTIPVSERSFAYWISVQRYRDGQPYREPFRLEREMVFESDYRIFIHLTVSEDGYLYVINEGPGSGEVAPSYNLLFPKTTVNGGEALLAAGQTLQLPELGGFRFDDEVGPERVWLAWTSGPAPPLEAVKGLANPRDLGVIGDEAQALAVHEFLIQHSKTPANADSIEGEQMTRVTGQSDVLVYPVVLEHR